MPVSPSRAAAFQILLRVENERAFAAELLHSSRYAKLSKADHALITEIVMGVLRWQAWLDQQISKSCDRRLDKLDLEVLIALRMATYQITFLERVPARAAVYESVELVKQSGKRSAGAFVNALLRRLTAQSLAVWPSDAASTIDKLAANFAHPRWLVERWAREFGLDAAGQICIYDQHAPATAIRICADEAEQELARERVILTAGRLLTSARRVESGDVIHPRSIKQGKIAIQDEASQLVALLAGNGTNILDCCAAPGGKTRVLAERNPEAKIIAMEVHPHRARLLRRMVAQRNVSVIAGDIMKSPLGSAFDRVLADVPCSGTGTLARNPEIKWRLTPEDLSELHARQIKILTAAMQHVAAGGKIVYSTCSLETEENSAVVEEALAANLSFHLCECQAELEGLRARGELASPDIESLLSGPYLRTLPGVHPSDGFFAAILKRG